MLSTGAAEGETHTVWIFTRLQLQQRHHTCGSATLTSVSEDQRFFGSTPRQGPARRSSAPRSCNGADNAASLVFRSHSSGSAPSGR